MSKKSEIKIVIFKSAPLLLGALFFIFGVALSVQSYNFSLGSIFFGPRIPTFAIGVSLSILLVVIGILFGLKKKIYIFVFTFIIILGFFMAQVKIERGYQDEGLINHDSINGKIIKVQENGENSISLILEDVNLINEEEAFEIDGKVNVIVYGQSATYLESEFFLPNSIVSIAAQLMYPSGAQEYGFTSDRLNMLSRGIYYKAVAHYAQIKQVYIAKQPFFYKFFYNLRKNTFGRLQRYIGDEEAAFMQAIITGNKGALSYGVKDDFASLGISHLLATSGLHIGILLLAIEYLLKKIRTPIIIKSIVCALFVLMFISFAGFRVSMIRAAIMWSMLMVSRIYGSKINPLNALGAAMLFMIIINPLSIFDISFVLSCFSVAAISLLFDKLSKLNKAKVGKKLTNYSFASLAVVLFTWPIIAYYFNSISLLSPIYNILFVPLSGIALFIGMIFSVLSGISPLAPAFGMIAKTISFLIIQSADFLARFAPSITMISPPSYIIILWILGFVLISGAVVKGKDKLRYYAAYAFLFVALIAMIITQMAETNKQQIRAYSDGSSVIIYMQDRDKNLILLNDDSYIIQSILSKSASNDLDTIIYFGNDYKVLESIIAGMDNIEIGEIYAALPIASEANMIGKVNVKPLQLFDFFGYEIELIEFSAKSKTAKTHYGAHMVKGDDSIIFLDPLSLRQGAFEGYIFDRVIVSRWSNSRVENIQYIDFDYLYYSTNDINILDQTLQLEHKGLNIYNISEGTKIIFTKEDR